MADFQQDWNSPWNTLFAQFISKHWKYALNLGTFQAFHINSSDTQDNLVLLGVLHRWFIGRQDRLTQGHFTPTYKLSKKASEAKSKLRSKVCLTSSSSSHLFPFETFLIPNLFPAAQPSTSNPITAPNRSSRKGTLQ